MICEPYTLHTASSEHAAELSRLINLSAQELSKEDYSSEEIEAAIAYIFGIDTQLILDKTYFFIAHSDQYCACGGWSYRSKLFGSDHYADGEPSLLDPKKEAAKIRSFFVHPNYARQGLARALLHHCEEEARRYGFSKAELMATLPGVKFYQTLFYEPSSIISVMTPAGTAVRFMPMEKKL